MGSCISKCSSSSKDINPIEDKIIIISQQSPYPSLPTIPISKKPHSPSLSSLTTATTTITTSSGSFSSTTTTTISSSSSSSKDGSFSNEFLWSCIKENPQIIQGDQVQLNPERKAPNKSPIPTSQTQKSRAISAPPKQSIPACTQLEKPKKVRGNSPSPVRQRSSRKEPERQKPVSLPKRNSGSQSPARRLDCRGLSPSPSRRFNGVASGDVSKNSQEANLKCGVACQNFNGETCKSVVGIAGINSGYTVAAGKENCPPRRGDCGLRTQPQVDQNVVGEMLSNHDSNSSVSVEDINNPHISLDCFIFL
eukprot:TRINITY_DN36712_c0_g1_i1.p1 TRINITY_DN36712_c0_g1~~TRINITY_DN36712_c0_g1_i1.p1  ORF type:complete len:308 (+),score=72.33 TRINITY_DN36712_c0_g1_i1:159-1082(+)